MIRFCAQKNIEESQSSAVAQATNLDNGIVKLELDKKANTSDLSDYSKTEAINTQLEAKADKVLFNGLESKVNDQSSGLDTKINSNQVGQAIGNAFESAVSSGGLVFESVTPEVGEIAQEIRKQVNSEIGVFYTTISSGATLAISKSIKDGQIKEELDKKADKSDIVAAVPIGTIMMWGKGDIPEGWLELNGQVITAEEYPGLSAIYGASLPDFRGYFLRGYGLNSNGVHSGELLGVQDDATALPKNRNNPFRTDTRGARDIGTTTDENGDGQGRIVVSDRSKNASSIQTSVNQTYNIISGGDAETRPKNIAVIYIIKAR